MQVADKVKWRALKKQVFEVIGIKIDFVAGKQIAKCKLVSGEPIKLSSRFVGKRGDVSVSYIFLTDELLRVIDDM